MNIETPGFTLDSRTSDNKLWVQSTCRPIGTFTCFSTEGDSQDSPVSVGDGQRIMIDHKIGEPLEQVVYVDYNVKENKTFLSEGYVVWKNCNFDQVHMHVVPKLTPYSLGSNTYFNLYGGYLILPAAGDGNIQVNPVEIQLVEIPFSLDIPTQRQSATFWDADYDTQTHQFSNLRPNLYGTGQYNIFGAEINFETVADVTLLDSNCCNLRTNDVAELGHGMRTKYIFETDGEDHDWKCTVTLTLNRIYSAEN